LNLPDVPFEAAVLRGALLTGLVHESEVGAWATLRLAADSAHGSALTDVVLAPEELTAQREALRPLAARSDPAGVATALQCWALREVRSGARAVHDCLRVLSDLRREGLLTPTQSLAVKLLEDRANMASVGMAGVASPTVPELAAALQDGLPSPRYVLTFHDAGEAAAFTAALSRKVDRDRRHTGTIARVWRAVGADSRAPVLILSEEAWEVARREFGPLPSAACIPYVQDVGELALLFDTESAVALGLEEAVVAFGAERVDFHRSRSTCE
jgi:hypothetical protein